MAYYQEKPHIMKHTDDALKGDFFMRSQNTAETSAAQRYLKAFLTGLLAAGVIMTGIYMLFAVVASMTDLPSAFLMGIVFLGIIAAGFFSGYIAARLTGNKGLLTGFVNGLAAAVLFLIISVCLFSSGLSLMLGIKLFLLVFLSACGGIFGVNSKKVRR